MGKTLSLMVRKHTNHRHLISFPRQGNQSLDSIGTVTSLNQIQVPLSCLSKLVQVQEAFPQQVLFRP